MRIEPQGYDYFDLPLGTAFVEADYTVTTIAGLKYPSSGRVFVDNNGLMTVKGSNIYKAKVLSCYIPTESGYELTWFFKDSAIELLKIFARNIDV